MDKLIITEQLEGHILSMYAKGMSTRAISEFIREMYAMEISATEISRITESVLPAVNEWRSRPLEAVYPFVFLCKCPKKSNRLKLDINV